MKALKRLSLNWPPNAGIPRRRHGHGHGHGHRLHQHGYSLYVRHTPVPRDDPCGEVGVGVVVAFHDTEIARVGRVGEDPRDDVRVGVGVVECQLKQTFMRVVCSRGSVLL